MMTPLKKQVTLCALGTIFEWYDFALFACLAPIFSQIFFQHTSQFAGLMGTFAVFASGYVMRPIGAIVFGKLGDQFGRKYSLLITIFTMTVATTAIGFIPTGSEFATLFLVICRLAQGFACSGEYPGVLTLLAEQNNVRHKAFIASTGVFATGIGGVMGALVYIILMNSLASEQMLAWGWRIPFLLGAPLGIVGYYLRKYILESKEFIQLKEKKLLAQSPLLDVLRFEYKNLLAVLSISILTNAIIYINYVYLGNYAFSIHKINASQVMYLALMVTFLYSFSILFCGFLADYCNKKIMLVCGCVLLAVFVYPLFNLIMYGSVLQQFVGQALLVCLLGIVMGPFASVLPEQFPARVRYSGLSLTLNFAASFFGGSAPMVCGWLTKVSGTPLAPAFYIMTLAVFAFFGARFILSKKNLQIVASNDALNDEFFGKGFRGV